MPLKPNLRGSKYKGRIIIDDFLIYFFSIERLYAINMYHKEKKINYDHISRDEYMHKISTYMYEY